MRRRLLLALLAIEAGCASRPPPPPLRHPHHATLHRVHHTRHAASHGRTAPPEASFLAATRVRCSNGDANACRMLRAMLLGQ